MPSLAQLSTGFALLIAAGQLNTFLITLSANIALFVSQSFSQCSPLVPFKFFHLAPERFPHVLFTHAAQLPVRDRSQ